MKLVIGGATGFVGREVLRQALNSPEITSIVTIGRRPVTVVDSTNIAKLTDIVMEDGEHYSESDIEKIANADACIWTIAVARTKALTTPFDICKKVTRDYTLAGIDALTKSNNKGKPLRFIYMSGVAISRDMNQDFRKWDKTTSPEMHQLRCMLEIELVSYASNSKGKVEICCVRPGYIAGDREIPGWVPPNIPEGIPQIERRDLVAACLKMGIDGIEKDPLSNDDAVRIGEEALGRFG
ncbi:uncharacterized protein PAC_02580 [Phialocephala subalpina]|uniref:NAD(P)-binding domain-containing protein n=1 Tax=Phialocephala subalpina TaxID=576137 RepID=A0A1L7WIV2_9HELO|nr:uncharacterized protein PAC_02580 [Phialocephala subalpina]